MQCHRKFKHLDGFGETSNFICLEGKKAVRGLAIGDTGEVGKDHIKHGGIYLFGLFSIVDGETSRV